MDKRETESGQAVQIGGPDDTMEKEGKVAVLPLAILFGVAFGNVFGLGIGVLFIKNNIGIGLLIGDVIGIIIGLVFGVVIDSIRMEKENNAKKG